MAALIEEQTEGVVVEVTPGDKGEFTVWVGETCVARKDAQGFPSEQAALASVARALDAAT